MWLHLTHLFTFLVLENHTFYWTKTLNIKLKLRKISLLFSDGNRRNLLFFNYYYLKPYAQDPQEVITLTLLMLQVCSYSLSLLCRLCYIGRVCYCCTAWQFDFHEEFLPDNLHCQRILTFLCGFACGRHWMWDTISYIPFLWHTLLPDEFEEEE